MPRFKTPRLKTPRREKHRFKTPTSILDKKNI